MRDKKATLRILEREIFSILISNQKKDLAIEMQNLYIWLLEH